MNALLKAHFKCPVTAKADEGIEMVFEHRGPCAETMELNKTIAERGADSSLSARFIQPCMSDRQRRKHPIRTSKPATAEKK